MSIDQHSKSSGCMYPQVDDKNYIPDNTVSLPPVTEEARTDGCHQHILARNFTIHCIGDILRYPGAKGKKKGCFHSSAETPQLFSMQK
jgi:hypothetical protein